ncbi:helix-turn-helix domain-containing protein [Calditrichota bacterium]
MIKLGEDLKSLRLLRKLSLAAVAEPAKISAAYLQKLENGVVKNPSPRVLMRISQVLDCDYDRLMELSGYAVPYGRGNSNSGSNGTKTTFLEAALRNENLSENEERAVLAFISYLKDLRKKK